MASYEHALIIINPVSGQHDADETQRIIEARCEEAGTRYETRYTEGEGDAEAWAEGAQEEGFDVVIVAGGDGTAMEAAAGLIRAESDVPLAPIPTGTANLVARALRIPVDIADAADVVFSGRPERLDVGYIPDRDEYFSLMVGAGFDARLVKDASRELKNWLSYFAYIVGGIKNLFTLYEAEVDVEVDGTWHTKRAHTVLVLNIGRIGETIELDPDIKPNDGKLDLAFISAPSPLDALYTAVEIMTQRARKHTNIEYMTAERVRFRASPRLPIHVDGELEDPTPLEAEIVPSAVTYIVHEDWAA